MDTGTLISIVSLLAIFSAVSMVVFAFGKIYADRQLKRRLSQVVGQDQRAAKAHRGSMSTGGKMDSLLDSLSKLSLPEKGWQDSSIKLRFIRAGLRDPGAPRVYYAVKTVGSIVAPLALAGVLLTFFPTLGMVKTSMFVVALAAAGYYLPDLYLNLRSSSRAQEMQDTLPDLIDLLVICVESGLGMDAAMTRVSREIARSSVSLSEEFYLASLEIRAGAGRTTALKNLALRINLEDLYALVSMLVQADKFGTSLGDSLRIQSEVMRVKRMQRAEAAAAKVPVKMLFPLIFFIFPALMIVLLGPAFIQISGVFGK